mgnify:CR=1 FL=1
MNTPFAKEIFRSFFWAVELVTAFFPVWVSSIKIFQPLSNLKRGVAVNMAFWQFMATQKGDWMETTIHQLYYAQE